MEKTSILDFITKLTGGSAQAPRPEESDFAETASREADEKPSFGKSYNPFADVKGERSQISSPRAPLPPKSTIDLNGGKTPRTKTRENSSDMIKLINRHNIISERIKKNNADD